MLAFQQQSITARWLVSTKLLRVDTHKCVNDRLAHSGHVTVKWPTVELLVALYRCDDVRLVML